MYQILGQALIICLVHLPELWSYQEVGPMCSLTLSLRANNTLLVG